ncbi:MAG TPA: high potential iron sulfur protein [Pseudolabrys sp.]|nr:high potential iron sulfur protein [Pseudolabrys sp.]
MSSHRKRGPDAPLSRRQVLPTLVGAASAAILLAANDVAAAPAKTDQRTAKYQDHPNNGLSCTQCSSFHPPSACQRVAGGVSANGWCNFFAKKP